MGIENKAESDFVNVKGAQESIPPAHVAQAESIPGLLKRLQIQSPFF